MCAVACQRPEEGIESSGVRQVRDSSEPASMGARNQPWILWVGKQPALFPLSVLQASSLQFKWKSKKIHKFAQLQRTL